jgi:hypothetical protein
VTYTIYAQGTSPYNDGTGAAASRWGDYSGAAPDPTNPQQVWLAAEYTVNADGSANASPYWVTQIGEFTYTPPCIPANTAPGAYAKAVMGGSPLGYWRLDDAATAGCVADSSGNHLNGTAGPTGVTHGQPGAPLGDGDTAMGFDGANGYVSLGDPAALQPAQVSVEAWVNATASNSPVATIVRKRLYGYDLYLTPSGQPAFSIDDSNAIPYGVTGATAVTDGKWHYLVGTYGQGLVCLYVDGVKVSCVSAGNIYYQPGAVAIGRDGDYPGAYFHGRIDDVAIYGTALTAAQVQAHYAARQASTTTLAASPLSSVFGQTVTITATVRGAGAIPTGTVTFKDGASALGTGSLRNGVATLATRTLAVGAHSLSASYAGDTNFAGSASAATSVTVGKAQTTTSLASSANPAAFGQPVTFTARVLAVAPGSGLPAGSVTFKDGTTILATVALNASSFATLTAGALAVGAHGVTAVYAGSGSFNISTSAVLAQTVHTAGTTTALTSSANPAVYGQPVTLTAKVTAVAPGSGLPAGSVTFKDGATTLATVALNASSIATFTTRTAAVGAHSLTAACSGSGSFNISASTVLTKTINKAYTTTVLTSSANPSVHGQVVTFAAKVTAVAPGGGIPTGTVTFKDGATTLATVALNTSGVATFTTGTLAVVTHSLTAVYGGSGSFTGSTVATLTQTVNRAGTTATVTSSANPSIHGQAVTFTARVVTVAPGSGTSTGTVTFKDGDVSLGTGTLVAGAATLTTSGLVAGAHSITAVYSGDASFLTTTSAALSQTVS